MVIISKRKSFARDVVLFVLWMIPIVYLAMIAAVMMHEVIGHGIVAAALGGTFSGFGIRPDAMGWASIDIIALTPLRQATVFAGGAVVTTMMSILFFVLGYRWRNRFFCAATLWVFAFAFLCDGVPYFFWDSIYQGVIGDPSAILRLYPLEGMRIAWIIGSGLIGVASILGFNHLMLTHTFRFLNASQQNRPRGVVVLASALFGIQSLAWLSFDWQQLIPVTDIGILPYVVPIALTASALGGIAFRVLQRATKAGGPAETGGVDKVAIFWKAPLLSAWGAAIFVVIIIVAWFQFGVLFG